MTIGQIAESIIIGLATILGGLAQAGFDASGLMTYGPMGIFLGWLMFRMEAGINGIKTELRELQAERGRATRAQMLMLVEIPAIATAVQGQPKFAVKSQIEGIIGEVDEAQKQREIRGGVKNENPNN